MLLVPTLKALVPISVEVTVDMLVLLRARLALPRGRRVTVVVIVAMIMVVVIVATVMVVVIVAMVMVVVIVAMVMVVRGGPPTRRPPVPSGSRLLIPVRVRPQLPNPLAENAPLVRRRDRQEIREGPDQAVGWAQCVDVDVRFLRC